jgi:hypothetical protein
MIYIIGQPAGPRDAIYRGAANHDQAGGDAG